VTKRGRGTGRPDVHMRRGKILFLRRKLLSVRCWRVPGRKFGKIEKSRGKGRERTKFAACGVPNDKEIVRRLVGEDGSYQW